MREGETSVPESIKHAYDRAVDARESVRTIEQARELFKAEVSRYNNH